MASTTVANTTMYCGTAANGQSVGACFTETCTGPVSDPVAVDNCAVVAEDCVGGVCATGAACVVGENTTCRSGADGTGTAGVCTVTDAAVSATVGTCTACVRTTTTVDTVTTTTSDCPLATDYCVEVTGTTGNYCLAAPCTSSGCDPEQTCDTNNTGACVATACTAADTCATKVCTIVPPATTGVCAQCDATAGSGNECPVTEDDDSAYVCTAGVCGLVEDSGISGGGIAGIIIGSVVFLGAVVGLTLYCCKKDNKSHDAMQEALK
jgi:hypothetical protein